MAVAYVKTGTGMVKVNGVPIELITPVCMRVKSYEPILLVGKEKFAGVDIRVRVRGGGDIAQIYAIRQAIAKAIVAWNQKYVDEQSKREIKQIYLDYDRSLLVADPRRCEPKKFGGCQTASDWTGRLHSVRISKELPKIIRKSRNS